MSLILPSPWKVTLSVWKALFYREMSMRLFSSRLSWLWLIAEPIMHISFISFLFAVVRVRTVSGIEVFAWLMLGLHGFFLFKRTTTQMMNAVSANQALFVYRQVKVIDTVLVRGFTELTVALMVLLVMIIGVYLFGFHITPEQPLLLMSSLFSLWLLGVGLGLISSVCQELLPNLARVLLFMLSPLYLVSGVIFPVSLVQPPYRDWFLLNPLVHAIEGLRYGYSAYYHVMPELNIAYVYHVALISLVFGLSLHRAFALKMVTR